MQNGVNFVSKAQQEAEALGHEIEWDEVGHKIAHGHCVKCGMTLSAASPDGLSKTVGDALEHRCSGSARNAAAESA